MDPVALGRVGIDSSLHRVVIVHVERQNQYRFPTFSARVWIAAAAAGLHSLTYHPDYLTYINFPRDKPYLDISDSNVDWGQGLKQLRHYLDSHPGGGRKIWFFGFGTEGQEEYYLGDKVSTLTGEEPCPTSGLLVISPVQVLGIYNEKGKDTYTALRNRSPDAVIGHSLMVFDLDRMNDHRN